MLKRRRIPIPRSLGFGSIALPDLSAVRKIPFHWLDSCSTTPLLKSGYMQTPNISVQSIPVQWTPGQCKGMSKGSSMCSKQMFGGPSLSSPHEFCCEPQTLQLMATNTRIQIYLYRTITKVPPRNIANKTQRQTRVLPFMLPPVSCSDVHCVRSLSPRRLATKAGGIHSGLVNCNCGVGLTLTSSPYRH